LRIIDTYPSLLSIIDITRFQNFDIERWTEYASSILPLLAEKIVNDSKNYDLENEIIPVISKALADRKKLNEAHESFVAITTGLTERIAEITSVDIQVDIILYLGLCNGAGWATTLGSRPAILLGIEKIVELDWCTKPSMAGLLYHEIGHVWHDAVGAKHCDSANKGDRAVWQLFREGIAMYFEQLILNNFTYYHQNKCNWLQWCQINKSALINEYRRRIVCEESVQSFFGDWCEYEGYSDAGYFLGCEFVKHLLKQYSLEVLARFDVTIVRRELFSFS
jgi:hypothetical protein